MTTIPANLLDRVTTGNARELARLLPDESVDLCFTDPIYDREADYQWLAAECLRVLAPRGAVLVWSNGRWHRRNANWLEAAGLTYRWDFACVIATGPAPMNGRIIAKTNRVLWLDRGGDSSMRDYLSDGYASTTWSCLRKEGAWTKNPRFTGQALQAFSEPDALVWDPFAGGGTIPATCRALGRRFVAFECDPQAARAARDRIAATTPPLFIPDPAPPPAFCFDAEEVTA